MPYCETARRIFLDTLDQLQMEKVIQRQIDCANGVLRVYDRTYVLNRFRSVRVVSLGKAAVPMAAALMEALRPELACGQLLDGILVGPTAAEHPGLLCLVGDHPIPDERSLLAGEAVLRFVSGIESDCLVFFLISGGASAMVEKPLDAEMTKEDTASFHRVLVHSGLRIGEMNTLRKHFSAIKGGRLAVAAGTATQCTLLVSDVPTDALHVIGSGPTMPDPSTVASCHQILARDPESLPFSPRVMRFFASAAMPETPKEDDPAFSRASAFVLLSSDAVCAEARGLAQREGFHVVIDNGCDEWACEDAAEYLLQRMAGLRQTHRKVCLLSAGEISVKLEGEGGIGGRNQHFVLACAQRLSNMRQRMTVLSAGTDGIDGNSTAAGGVTDETTCARAAAMGFDVDAALARFDSNSLLHALGDTLVTGPSGNNVRDLRILLSSAE